MNKAVVVVDAKGHLLGRTASYVAKQLEQGQRVVIVRCEHMLMSGSHFRSKLKYMDFLRKRMSTNPKKGPIHQKAPSRIVWRVIRGMIPHKTPKGAAAMGRLKCFDGVPLSFNSKKKMCIPDALKMVRLKPRARYSCVGDVARECGWTKGELIDSLEQKRITKNHKWFTDRKNKATERRKILKNNSEINKVNIELAALGY
jgi:large subunit ribosomal protein L13Ae